MPNRSEMNNSHDSRLESKFNYHDVQVLIDNIELILMKSVENYQNISSEELISYFDEPAPSGDLTTLSDILDKKWLLIHELVELSELKLMNLQISSHLLRTHPMEVEYAHITATEYEFKFAREGNDNGWIESRLKDVRTWLEDDDMPEDLKCRCFYLIDHFSL